MILWSPQPTFNSSCYYRRQIVYSINVLIATIQDKQCECFLHFAFAMRCVRAVVVSLTQRENMRDARCKHVLPLQQLMNSFLQKTLIDWLNAWFAGRLACFIRCLIAFSLACSIACEVDWRTDLRFCCWAGPMLCAAGLHFLEPKKWCLMFPSCLPPHAEWNCMICMKAKTARASIFHFN